MNPQPDLTALTHRAARYSTAHLALHGLAVCDAWPLWQATRNDGFNRNLVWKQLRASDEVLALVETLLDEVRLNKLAALSAVVRDTGEWMGLYRLDKRVLERLGFIEQESVTVRTELGVDQPVALMRLRREAWIVRTPEVEMLVA